MFRIGPYRWWWLGGVAFQVGCAARNAVLPAGHLPPPPAPLDVQTAIALTSGPTAKPEPATKTGAFQIPQALPGGGMPFVTVPKFAPTATPGERDHAVRAAYPVLTPVAATIPRDGAALSLPELEQLAMANSPAIKKATAEAAAVYGQVIQAGLYPNPTAGYQVDQVQPNLRIPPGSTASGAGQQGGFINQLIKTAGKLSLAQQVAGFDYINALVAVRASQVAVTAKVRSAYFTALVAQRNAAISKALADMIDEVYGLQLKRVAAGVDAGYEPLQLYAQAVQARSVHAQAQATVQASWKQLAAAVGQPDLPPSDLAGQADAVAPVLDEVAAKARILEQHTDLLTARNSVAQSRTNLVLQRRMPIPDIGTNQYHQYDNAAQTYQFGVQIGIALPIFDRNQGHIRTAESKIVANALNLEATRNDLFAKFAEAYGRYRASTVAATNSRDKVLPSLTQAYQAIVRRYQVEPDKVGFGDIVVAQQNLATALQTYLQALDTQWKAVVDTAEISQVDELYPTQAK